MDSTPPSRRSESRLRTKLAARFAAAPPPLELTSPPKKAHLHPPPSPLHLAVPSPGQSPKQLRDLLLISPLPRRSSRQRGLEKAEPLEELVELVQGSWSRRRCKSKALAAATVASPRNTRRVLQRAEEERDSCVGDDGLKVRRRKRSRSRREKLGLAPAVASPKSSPAETKDTWLDEESFLDRTKQLFTELVMWKNVAKSSLWFRCGSLFLLSSSLTRGVSFSIVSAASQLGLLILTISFLYKTFSQRRADQEPKKEFKLREDDIVRAAKYVLPVANASIRVTRELFSGEPAMTMKMAPVLLFVSEYGHWITLWRLFFIAFFTSFTIPKLYSSYSKQIDAQVEGLKCRVRVAWAASSHKKIVATLAVTAFWNLSEAKTRLFAAFLSVVIIRYYRQHVRTEIQEDDSEVGQEQALKLEGKEDEHLEAMEIEDKSGESEKQALVVV